MGNSSVKGAVDYLKDPYLVRRIQERLGVKEIIVEPSYSPREDSSPDEAPEAAPHPQLSCTAKSSAKDNGEADSISGPADAFAPRNEDAANKAHSQNLSSTLSNGGGFMNGGMEWLAQKAKKRRKIPSLTPTPDPTPVSSPHSSPRSKTAPPLPTITIESIPFLDICFRLATELGYEPFYITFFPFFCWNIDTAIMRHAVILWCLSMYVGQACKALFKLKRPASPPALRLENNPMLETEYGFPSTHAIVSTVVPFHLFVIANRFEVCARAGCVCVCVYVCVLTCCTKVIHDCKPGRCQGQGRIFLFFVPIVTLQLRVPIVSVRL